MATWSACQVEMKALMLVPVFVASFVAEISGRRSILTTPADNNMIHSVFSTFEASVLHKIHVVHSHASHSYHQDTLSPAAYYHISRFQQQEFCEEYDGIPIPGTRVVENTKHHYNITVLGDNDVVSKFFAQGGGWEDDDVEVILQALAAPLPDDVPNHVKNARPIFMDIGANLGTFTLAVAAHGHEVLAFEGSRTNRWALRNSICSNPRLMPFITLYPMGLGAKRETCYVVVDKNNQGNGNAVCGVTNAADAVAKMGNPNNFVARGTMQVHPLDSVVMTVVVGSWIHCVQRPIRVMKIDVEGFEPFVFAGAQKLLAQATVWRIHIEINPSTLRRTAVPGKAYTDFVVDLMKMGYSASTKSWDGPWVTEQEVQSWPATRFEGNIMLTRTRW